MTDTSTVARKSDGKPAAGRPLVDEGACCRCGCCPTPARPGRVSHSPGGRSSPQPAPAPAPSWSPATASRRAPAAPQLADQLLEKARAEGETVLTDIGAVDLAVPRDRNGSFEPQIVRKGQTRLKGFNDRIIALYARGMTTRDIRAHLREMYDVDVSPDLISRVTDAVAGDLAEWQSRALDRVWPVTAAFAAAHRDLPKASGGTGLGGAATGSAGRLMSRWMLRPVIAVGPQNLADHAHSRGWV
jgi:hypothetical protein